MFFSQKSLLLFLKSAFVMKSYHSIAFVKFARVENSRMNDEPFNERDDGDMMNLVSMFPRLTFDSHKIRKRVSGVSGFSRGYIDKAWITRTIISCCYRQTIFMRKKI